MFQNFPGRCISDLLFELSKFQHYTQLYSKYGTLLFPSLNFSPICWWKSILNPVCKGIFSSQHTTTTGSRSVRYQASFPGIKLTKRGFDKPPHLVPRLRKSKRVHLLPCCPFTSCYDETFTSLVKISLDFYQAVRKTIFVHGWFRMLTVCSKTFTRHTWLPRSDTICGQRPNTERTKNLHILLNGNINSLWLVHWFRWQMSVDRFNIYCFSEEIVVSDVVTVKENKGRLSTMQKGTLKIW